MSFPALENLVRQLSALPGIGQRSALRIAFHLLKTEEHQPRELGQALVALRDQVRFCKVCGGLSETEMCDICSDTERDDRIICVVEEPGDIFSIEKTGEFRGRYHVLLGALSPLDGVGPEDLRFAELTERLEAGAFEELFVATNPTLEGDATANYLQDLLADREIRLTRISHGIPTGSSIEYADQNALARSIRGRQDL